MSDRQFLDITFEFRQILRNAIKPNEFLDGRYQLTRQIIHYVHVFI